MCVPFLFRWHVAELSCIVTFMKSDRADDVKRFLEVVSLVRGLYGRIAAELNVDPSLVSRVAHGKRRSKKVEDALRKEVGRVLDIIEAKSRVKEGRSL
jgi:hypothetical protein